MTEALLVIRHLEKPLKFHFERTISIKSFLKCLFDEKGNSIENLHFSVLNNQTNTLVQTIPLDAVQVDFPENDEERVNNNFRSRCTMLIPGRFFLVTTEAGYASRGIRQGDPPCECGSTTNLEIYDHFSEDLRTCQKRQMRRYPSGDAHMIQHIYNKKSDGLFMIWEIRSKNHNELVHYDIKTHRVINTSVLKSMGDGFIYARNMPGDDKILVASHRHLAVYSVPELQLLKSIQLQFPKNCSFVEYYNGAVAISDDLVYVAYGSSQVFLLNTQTNHFEHLDPLYSNRLDMSWIYPIPSTDQMYLSSCYRLADMVFIDKTHILAAVSLRGEYYQWDIDARKKRKQCLISID